MGYFECHIEITPGNTSILKTLNTAGQLAFEHYCESEGCYVLDLTTEEVRLLELYCVKVEQCDDLEALAKIRKAERAAIGANDDSDDAPTTGFVDHYMDAAEVNSRIGGLAAEFPALCQLTTLPYPTSGYDGSIPELGGPSDVSLLRITNTPSERRKPGLLLICGTHAREWVNPLIAIEFAEQLLRNYDPTSSDPQIAQINRIIEEGDIFIVPVMNPDGFNYSFHDDTAWRKNRRPNPSSPGCPGVDNNRNYSVYFGDPGSSSSPCSNNYYGPGFFSEPENRNIRYILEEFPNILIGVDSHSRGEKIFRPTATGGVAIGSLPVSPDDEVIYQELEAAAVAAIQTVSGKTYATGTTSNHAGTSDEYMFFAHRVFGFDFECALLHQPPIEDALVSVQEVSAALRILAVKAIDLDVEAVTPTSIVQCIDRTGSMVTFGYEEGARANARRFTDLMSIRDRTAVVSFADPSADPDSTPFEDRAVVEFPITEINDPGDFADVQASIDDIVFGGWTPIGAGLSKSADQLSSSTTSKSVVLLSDGFENRQPWTANVLSGFPEDIRVYTIALGDLADVDLLHDVAAETDGRFYMSPTTLELHEIYNQIRADVSDDDLVISTLVTSEGDDLSTVHHAYIERGAMRLTVSLSWEGKDSEPDLTILAPSGRKLSRTDWGIDVTKSDGYFLIKINRPMPGRWHFHPKNVSTNYVIAAFVRSPIQIELGTMIEMVRHEPLASVLVGARSGNSWASDLSGIASLASVRPFGKDFTFSARYAPLEWIDAIPENIRLSSKPRHIEEKACEVQGFSSSFPCGCPANAMPAAKNDVVTGLHRFRFTASITPGIYNVRLRIEGTFSNGVHFERASMTTLVMEGEPKEQGHFKIFGKVVEKGTKRGIPGLIVEALDKDLCFDDRLGSVITDKSGTFELTYDRDDFQDLFLDKKPDIYLRVKSPSGKVIHTTEGKVRHEAGKTEAFIIHIPKSK